MAAIVDSSTKGAQRDERITPYLGDLKVEIEEGTSSHNRTSGKEVYEFLQEGAEILEERGRQYDSNGGEQSMGQTVEMFNICTGHNLKESEGWLLLQFLKDVRQWKKEDYHEDSAIDCVNYAALKASALSKNK